MIIREQLAEVIEEVTLTLESVLTVVEQHTADIDKATLEDGSVKILRSGVDGVVHEWTDDPATFDLATSDLDPATGPWNRVS